MIEARIEELSAAAEVDEDWQPGGQFSFHRQIAGDLLRDDFSNQGIPLTVETARAVVYGFDVAYQMVRAYLRDEVCASSLDLGVLSSLLGAVDVERSLP